MPETKTIVAEAHREAMAELTRVTDIHRKAAAASDALTELERPAPGRVDGLPAMTTQYGGGRVELGFRLGDLRLNGRKIIRVSPRTEVERLAEDVAKLASERSH